MKKRVCRFESLQPRELLAGDLTATRAIDESYPASAQHALAAPIATDRLRAEGEGEDAVDKVAFARMLADSGTELYCASWSFGCVIQRQLFEDGDDFLPYREVGTPDRFGNDLANEAGIESIPTWQFPDGSRRTDVLSLEEIAAAIGVELPTSALPFFKDIGSQVVEMDSPLHVPIDAYNANGGDLTFTIEVADPDMLEVQLLENNRSIEIVTVDYGNMVFELFEQRAPQPTARVIELAEADFYDGVDFHRVIDNFVIQGGDPTGTGAGGSELGDFDDQFHLDLQHNKPGMLSYAKADDDTNDSQFFITDRELPHLDFNHSVFGVLVEGDRIRDAINGTATVAGDRPLYDIPMDDVRVFEDNENAVMMLRGLADSGTTEVAVTVTNAAGETYFETFFVTLEPRDGNRSPFLLPIPAITTEENEPVQFQLEAVDREDDPVSFSVGVISVQDTQVQVDDGGIVTVTPPPNFVGTIRLRATVQHAGSSTDIQEFDVEVLNPHHNYAQAVDVNGDGTVAPNDVLAIINLLNAGIGSTQGLDAIVDRMPDVTNDQFIAPNDVLQVVNFLNRSSGGSAEGEASAQLSAGKVAVSNDLALEVVAGEQAVRESKLFEIGFAEVAWSESFWAEIDQRRRAARRGVRIF